MDVKRLKIIATGTGRCGTGFVSRLLTSAGMNCGHERFFNTGGYDDAIDILSHHWKGTVAESSWLAAPFLDSEVLQDAYLIVLLRHPLHFIKSVLRIAPHITPPYRNFAEMHAPRLKRYDNLLDWAACKWVEWNKLIEGKAKGRQGALFHIEREPSILVNQLVRAGFELDTSDLFSDRRYNTKGGRPVNATLEDISDKALLNELKELAEKYHYKLQPRKVTAVKGPVVTKAIVTTLDNLENLKETVSVLKSEPIDEIVIVNNGSIDGTREWLAEQEGLTVINRQNLGAGPGRNAGLDKAGEFDYVLMLDGGIRPLRGGTQRMVDYLNNVSPADVVGVEIADFETDKEQAWRRWPGPIIKTYTNTRLSHTAYCLARFKAFDGIRFSEDGPFGEPGWGADDDELAYQWNEKGITVHVTTGIHPYRHASGSFRRLFAETGIWPNQYGSVYEKRVVWLQHHWPQYQPGNQWGEPWLTLVVKANGVDKTAKMIKAAHDRLRQRSFKQPWNHIPNPYSIIAWGDGDKWLDWATPRHLRQHHGTVAIVNGEIVKRSPDNEPTWTGDFRLCTNGDCISAIRPESAYCAIVNNSRELDEAITIYNQVYPPQKDRSNPPGVRQKWLQLP